MRASLPSVPTTRLVGHDGPVQVVRFTSDGKYCLTGGHDRNVRLWNPFRLDPASTHDTTSRSSETVSFRPHGPHDLAFDNLPPALPIQTYSDGFTHPIGALMATESNTSQILLAASDKTLVVSDLVTKQVMRRLQGHSGRINAVAAADKGEAFLTASYDGTVCIFDGRSRDNKPIQVLREAKDSVTDIYSVQFAGGGGGGEAATGLVCTASVDGMVRTYDLRYGVLKCDDCGSPISSMAQTHDGQCLAISCLDGTIRLMETNTGELLNTFSGHKSGQFGLEVAILADDSTIATGSEDGPCILYDIVRANRVQSLEASTRPTCSIAAHPQKSSVLITASYDGNTIVWSNN